MRCLLVVALCWSSVLPAIDLTEFTNIPFTGASAPSLTPLDDRIRISMANNPDLGPITAAAVAIMFDRRVVYARGFGWRDQPNGDLTPVQPDDLMRIASVTKPIIAAAVRKLIADGEISADDRVFQIGNLEGVGILPEDVYYPYNGILDSGSIGFITVGNLLLHRGGWNSFTSFDPQFSADTITDEINMGSVPPLSLEPSLTGPPGPVNTVRYMLAQPLQFIPGATSIPDCYDHNKAPPATPPTHCYSNFGYMLLALIIEEVTGQNHLDWIHENMLAKWGGAPQEMKRGRTFRKDQDPTEPFYDSGGLSWPNVFLGGHPDCPSPCQSSVPPPYGGWEQEVFIGHGDIITNTTQMLHFLDRYWAYTFYGAGSAYEIGKPLSGVPSSTWIYQQHEGSIPGTYALHFQRSDGLRLAVICNQRTASSEVPAFIGEVLSAVQDEIPANSNPTFTRFATDNWIEFNVVPSGEGTFDSPADGFPSIYPSVAVGGHIKLKPGTVVGTGTFDRPVTITAPLGSVTITNAASP